MRQRRPSFGAISLIHRPHVSRNAWPEWSNQAYLISTMKPPMIGVDIEWNIRTDQPTILGVSDGETTVSCYYDEGRAYLLDLLERHPDIKICGHNFLQSDFGVLNRDGFNLKTENIVDSILYHWLLAPHLCKGSKPTEDQGEQKRGAGFMSLFPMVSLYTELPNWKLCCGEDQCLAEDRPCSKHNPLFYNAVDSISPLLAFPKMQRAAQLRGVEKLYPLHRDLSVVLARMSRDGIFVDVPYINKLREEFVESRRTYWDDTTQSGCLPFNPKSPKQVLTYFKGQGIDLEDSSEETIRELLEYHSGNQALSDLLDFKEFGKGPDPWFAPREWSYKDGEWVGYVDESGFVHPTFVFFTSSCRLAAFGPSVQNISIRRINRKTKDPIGLKMRRCVIAPDGHYLYTSDLSNAENRNFLHLAGYTELPNIDLHTWVKEMMNLSEEHPFAVKMGGARQAAKSVQHACLTENHEVLTPYGWIPIQHYDGQQIAQWDTTGSIKFAKPQAFLSYDCVAEETFSLSGRGLMTRVTTNHEFPVVVRGNWKDRKYAKWRRSTVDQLPKSGAIAITGVLEDQPETLTDLEILRAVAVQADGSIPAVGYQAHFHLVKERKKQRVRDLFGVIGRPDSSKSTAENFSVPIPNAILDPNKSFNSNVLKMSQRQRLLFLNEVLLWDGHIGKCSKVYSNTDVVSLKWIQTIAHLAGSQALLRKTNSGGFEGSCKTVYNLRFNRRKYACIQELAIRKTPYTGKVYCFKTDTGFFLTRYYDTISVTGNSNYGEGLALITKEDLRKPSMLREISAGARVVFRDWTFNDGAREYIVSFTGGHLAERAFGSKSYEARKLALDVQEKYFGRFPKVRELQKRITKQIEKERCIRPPNGYCTLSYGLASDRIKTALAVWGSQPIAHITKLAMLRAEQDPWLQTCGQFHDALNFYVDARYDPKEVKKRIEDVMVLEMAEIPGLRVPCDVKYGPRTPETRMQSTWGDQIKI